MKVCSFLPAATKMLYEMQLEEFLCGVTFECHSNKPRVVLSVLENNNYSSQEIDKIVSKAKAEGTALYYIDEDLLNEIAPDIIFTQDVCDVCQIDTAYVQKSVSKLDKQPQLISLVPKNLDDIFDNAITIASALEREKHAICLIEKMKKRLDDITNKLAASNAPIKQVMVIEWLDPIYNCGHWIPSMITRAGGIDLLGNPNDYSSVVSWNKILDYNPELLVISPCGFKPERALQEIQTLTQQKFWNQLTAVKNNAIFLVDSDLMTCPSTSLVEGIELLAACFHPEIFCLDLFGTNVIHYNQEAQCSEC